MFKVLKRDGSLENFDRRKIAIGALKAGATNPEAEKLASQVEASLPSLSVKGLVKSIDIRTKSIQLLRNLNKTISTSYEYYRKPGE